MSSERRIESSRANGALSRGPITPEGKRRSSRNAEKHGIYSGSVLINGESPELYEEIRLQYFTRFEPADKLEEYLVDQLVACHWRMSRMASMEAATLDHQMDCQQPEIEESFESIDPSTRAAIAFQTLTDSTATLANYRRFESALARQFDRTARHLAEWQSKRKDKKLNYEPSPKIEQSAEPTEPQP
jgi:hypothetical protein